MSEFLPDSPDDEPFVAAEIVQEPLNRLSIGGIISWCAIFLVTVGLVILVAMSQESIRTTVGGDATSADLIQVQIAGKMLVGQQQLQSIAVELQSNGHKTGDDASEAKLATAEDTELEADAIEAETKAIKTAIEAANTGTYEQQLACAVLTNELLSPFDAQQSLNELQRRVDDHAFSLSESQLELRDAITRLTDACADESFDDATLTLKEEQLLDERMGWIGRLAVVPKIAGDSEERQTVLAEATSSLMLTSFAAIVGCVGIVVGFGLLALAFRRWRQGKLDPQFTHRYGVHNIYIETFAIWLVTFFGLQLAAGYLPEPVRGDGLLLGAAIMFGSLLVLVWPVARGIPLGQVRKDIGWTSQRPARDLLAAPLGYLATAPAVLIVLAVMIGIISVTFPPTEGEPFSRGNGISHPLQEHAVDPDARVIGLFILAACVVAPIVEETMFRGVLYRHLRDWTAHWRVTASVILSALVNSVIFAAVHPQGVFLIPVLGTLAIGFTLMREWRDSLYPSMIMHSIHNSLVTCLTFMIL